MDKSDLVDVILTKEGTRLGPSDRVALLASYSSGGLIKKYVEYYISRLSDCGFQVILIIACDELPDKEDTPNQKTSADFVILRENRGFDFGSWSCAFSILPELFDMRSCLLTNDSLFGPFGAFDALVDKLLILESQADLVSLTDNNEVMPHLQSYFLHLSAKMLASRSFRLFINSIQPFELKSQIISLYEIPFARFATLSGFSVGSIFSTSRLDVTENTNLTLGIWRELIHKGFPFVKIQLLRDNPCNTDLTGWEKILTDAGYDTDLVTDYLGML